MIWAQEDGSRLDMYANSFSVGSGWGSAELIEIDDAGNAYDGQVSVDADGAALAVWTQLDASGGAHLMSNRFTAATGWGGAEEIDAVDASGLSYGSRLSVSANGSAFVTWTLHDGSNFSIIASRFDPRVISP